MELLTLEITPLTNFSTYPKGDTIFGQIVSYFYLENDNSFDNYLEEKPKLIVSDMMPLGYVYKPSLPLKYFEKDDKELDKKTFRKKDFIGLHDLQNGNWHVYSLQDIKFKSEVNTIKNSISRVTFSTDGKDFAPYSIDEIEIYMKLWMFVLVDTDIKDKVLATLEKIGNFGFGKDTSIGKGKFEVKSINSTINFDLETDTCMSLSPTILLDDNNVEQSFYEPFVRFGKFGLDKAYENAFKKPVLTANSGAVVKLKEKKKFFGNSVDNGNSINRSFFQGYSIALPIKAPKDIQWK